MSVVDRSALEASPLADLHAIASELSIDGYRRLRRAELIDAILDRQEGGNGAGAVVDASDVESTAESTAEDAPPKRGPSRKAPEPEPVNESESESETVEPETETATAAEDEDEE